MKLRGAILATFLLALPARAELNWQVTGPGGGGAFASPVVSSDGAIWVGSDLSGAYQSLDGGKSWRVIGYRNGLQSTHVDNIAVDPMQPATVALASDGGLYLSRNCAAKHEALCQFTHKFEGQVTTTQFASSGVAYATGLRGYCQEGAMLWRSLDHGVNWSQALAQGLPHAANIMALRVQTGHPAHVIAISAPQRFSGPETCGAERWPEPPPYAAYESLDGGDHFKALALAGDIGDVKFDLADPQKLWATIVPHTDDLAQQGALYVRDRSDSLQLISREQTGQIWPLSAGGVRLLDLLHQRPWMNRPYNTKDVTGFWQWDQSQGFSHVTSPEDYAKWDLGWTNTIHDPLASLNGDVQSFTPVSDEEAWWVDDQFVYHVTQAGKMVTMVTSQQVRPNNFITRGINNAVGAVLAASPVDENRLYVGHFDLGCFVTDQAQAKLVGWESCNGKRPNLVAGQPLAGSPLNGNWNGFGGNVVAIAPDPEFAKVVYAVHSPHNADHGDESSGYYKVVRSEDGFERYDDLTFNLNALTQAAAIVALQVDVPSPQLRRLWAIAGGQLYKLEQMSWQRVATPCDGGLLVMAHKASTKVVGGSSGVCVSHDDGETWHTSQNSERIGDPHATWWGPFGATPYSISDFAFDPSTQSRIWMTVLLPSTNKDEPRAGLYRSDDGGEVWVQVKTFGLGPNRQRNFARTVVVAPFNPNVIVVGTSVASFAGGYLADVPMGAFISRDGGKSFQQENNGLAWPFITQLRFVGHRLYGLSPGQGIVYTQVK